MKKPIYNLFRTPRASLRLAGGLGLLCLAGFLTPSVSAYPTLAELSANIVIDAPPPPLRHELVVGVSPGPDNVWIAGYWGGTPGHYTWVGGRWDHPPHPHGQWSAPHWDKDSDGHYRQTKGEWRDSDPKR
jgi:hypothetical protein